MMKTRFIYSQYECHRIIPGVLIDNRANIPAIKNKLGSVIKAYTDAEADKVKENCVFYKIETYEGNMAGYFTLEVGAQGVTVLQFQLRSAFQQFNQEISGQISNFISSGEWRKDYLN